jgi:hypothetical protein
MLATKPNVIGYGCRYEAQHRDDEEVPHPCNLVKKRPPTEAASVVSAVILFLFRPHDVKAARAYDDDRNDERNDCPIHDVLLS